MTIIWSIAFIVSIFAFVFAVVKLSWVYMLVSTIASISIAYYFLGANNHYKYFALIPIFLLVLTAVLWFLGKARKPSTSFHV